MLPLDEWDVDYILNDVRDADESNELEKKASGKFTLTAKGTPDAETKEELAKQVSAFSNSGQGFIVYGIGDNKALETGVPTAIGSQPIKDWVEATIPTLVFPPVTTCHAKTIQIPGHHAGDKAILVVSVALSERRPHWTVSNQEPAYIRAGAHSSPMRRQTFLDLASRGSASEAEIEAINPSDLPAGLPEFPLSPSGYWSSLAELSNNPSGLSFSLAVCRILPTVRLLNGPVCERWAFELKVSSGRGSIEFPRDGGARINSGQHLYLVGTEPLFPGRSTPIHSHAFQLIYAPTWEGGFEIVAWLYAGSAQPVRRVFGQDDIDPDHKVVRPILD